MRRAVIHDSEEEQERPKTVRKTRAALAAASTEASPMRRSTRIRQGSVNRDGSSPESLNGSHAAPPVTRVTRRRAAAAAAEGTQLPDVPRVLRSRKTSLSSNASEAIDLDSAPGTPRKSKRLATIQSSPDTPIPKTTRQSARATSETKSPPPVIASTRRTRANSIEPEPIAIGTPTRKRRTVVSAPPNEPSVTEDANEDSGEDTAKPSLDDVAEVAEETEASSGKKSSRGSSSSSGKKSPKKVKPEIDESIIDREVSPLKKEDSVNTAEEAELLETPKEATKQDSSVLDIADGGKPIQKISSTMIHVNKRGSLDKSKELGVQIESLLNKSSEELANSPGDKENQKANVSPEKVRKNLEVTVSNVNIVRGKPGGFEFVNKSFETKINSWLDDRGLAKSRYETVTPKRDDVEENGKDSNLETRSPKKTDNEAKKERGATESEKKKKKLRLNVEKTVVDSVVVREFTLSESDSSDDSESEFSLTIEDDVVDKEKKGSAADSSTSKKSGEELNEEILERHTPKKLNSSSNREEDDQGNNSKRLNLSLKRLEDETEEKRRASMEKKPNEEIKEPESKRNGPEDEKNDSQEAMDTNVDEKTDHSKNPTPGGLAQDLISFEEPEPLVKEKNQSYQADESKRKSLIDSEIDSDVVVNTLFQNISAEEWKKKRDRSLAKRLSKRKSSRLPSNNGDDSDDDDLITVGDKTVPEDVLESDSDSDDTLILKMTADKKQKSMDQTILEEAETEDDKEKEKTKKKRKSLNKSIKSNTSLIENETEAETAKDIGRKSTGDTQEEKKDPKIDDDMSEAETIMTHKRRKSAGGNSFEEAETQDEEVEEEMTKKKRKSLNKSTKSNTSLIENETEAETAQNSSRKSIGKASEEKEDPKIEDEREAETQDEGIAEEMTKKKRKSRNKSTKSNTSLIENETEAETAKNSSRKSIGKASKEKEDPKIDDEREAETQDEEIVEEKPKKNRNSLNKSTKSNTSLIENEMEGDEEEETNSKSMSKASEEKEDTTEEVSEPMNTENSIVSMEEEKVEAEKQPRSAKKTPKKSNKVAYVWEFSDESGSDTESEEEQKRFVEPKSKSAKKSAVEMLKTPLSKNYSTIADVDSDSVRDDVSVSESSDEENTTLPGFLFSIPSSGDEDEDYNPNETKDESNDTIDSDVAKDLNLAGDDELEYSDNDVAADECRESESEHSDEDDNGSDMEDFVVSDDEVESSEEEEEKEESAKKTRFTRILDKSSSEDEAETEPIEEVETTPAEIAEESVVETPTEVEPAFVTSELRRRTLDYSPESARKSLSDKKSKKRKSGEELKPINGPAKALLDHTVDLCTPEQAGPEAGKKSSGKRERSSDKFRKNLVEELGAQTPVQSGAAKEEKTKTPKSSGKKEKRAAEKTPEAANKKNRDSMQLIQDLGGLTKPSVSDLNKTMDTPNSETPVTKFLKKERLNESLPFMKLKRKSSKSFDKTALNQMSEDEQEDEEPAENHERKDISEESGDEEEANGDAEETGDEINGNGLREDEEDDDTDQQPDENEDNGDENGDENENEDEENEESDEEEEVSVQIHVVEKKRNSKGRLSLTEELEGKTRLSNGRRSTSTVINGDAESGEDVLSSKKKQASNSALLELPNQKKRPRSTTSCETPQSRKKTKRFKSVPHTEEDNQSDSDEAPVSLGFGKAKTEAIQAMKNVADSLKAGKEAKKKKKREQLERIRQEKEIKAAKTNLKRLPEDLLENLLDVAERPKKKRKLSRKEEPILPSRAMFSPGKTPLRLKSLKIEEADTPAGSSVGGTTHFSVVNLEKVKKQPKKAIAAASFRELMLARNPRQPISAFLMYKAKQKAAGKQLPRKRTD